MNKHILFSVLISILFFIQKGNSQDLEKPKIAVVLSGGGAKGLAHIPLLQTLDSLGIVPDLIVGTSMGSVVGGFYAMGYSGDSIASITKHADWDLLLGGNTSLIDVSAEEKSEFGKYLVSFDISKESINLRSSLLNDQHLRSFFAVYTYPTYSLPNFDRLPIPFRAIATDIVNGEEVILKDGSLAVAMRASMSIPSIFRPVPYKEVLLVDGGILNNFPIDVAKDWGADIIIGSDVGGGMKTKEELKGITDVLFQSAMLVSNKKNPESRDNCDILIDHLPYLTYSTSDFDKSEAIYKQGVIGTRLQLASLVELSKSLKKYEQRKIAIPEVSKEFVLDTVLFEGISTSNLDLVKSRANIEDSKRYSVEDLEKGINRAMGTTLFNQITTKAVQKDSMLRFEIFAEEHTKNQLKTSLHYDTYRGVGLILNYTGRNILGESSRILFTGDIADQPRFRLQYQKQFGKNMSWWWRSDLLGEFLNQEVFNGNGDYADDLKSKTYQFDNEINRSIRLLESYVGIGFNYQSSVLKPKSQVELARNFIPLKKYDFKNFEFDIHFVSNTLNSVFFASHGTVIKAKISRSLSNYADVEYAQNITSRDKGRTNGFTKLSIGYQKRFPLQEKLTFILKANSGFIFEDKIKGDELSFDFFGFTSKYFFGGNLVSTLEDRYIFPGLHDVYFAANQFIKVDLRLQYHLTNNIFITPHLNYATVGFGTFDDYISDVLQPKGHWSDQEDTSSLFSAGVTASYNSLLGPVNFDLAWVNDINKVHLFFSAGLFLTISD
jgi:NTE family protein